LAPRNGTTSGQRVQHLGAGVGQPELPHAGTGQAQHRVLAHRPRIDLALRQRLARHDGVHLLPGIGPQSQHDASRPDLVLDPFGDHLPVLAGRQGRRRVGADGRSGHVLARPGDHEADVGQRLQVPLLAQQPGVGEVEREHAKADQHDQRPAPRAVHDDLVGGHAERRVEQADHEHAPDQPAGAGQPHPTAQQAHGDHGEQRAGQRYGHGAGERAHPHRVLADHPVDQVGQGERAGHLDQEDTRVVDGAVQHPPRQQCPEAGHDVRHQDDLERRGEQADHHRDLGERDRPRHLAAHVDVHRELFGQQEADGQQRRHPQQVGAERQGQPPGQHTCPDDAGDEHTDRVDPERSGRPHRVGRLRADGSGHVRTHLLAALGHATSSPGLATGGHATTTWLSFGDHHASAAAWGVVVVTGLTRDCRRTVARSSGWS
jgi:hypothetical protein